MAAHEQPVRVDAVGRAGEQGAQVLALHDLQGRHVLRLHDEDLVHLVGEGAREHGDGEGVAHLHLVQVGEEPRGGKPAVRGEHGVGGGAAHRQAAPLEVAHAGGQDGVGRAVVDRQVHAQLLDGDVAHDVGGRDAERLVVLGREDAVTGQGGTEGRQVRVVGVGLGKEPLGHRAVHVAHGRAVVGHGAGLHLGVPPVRHAGIQHDGAPYEKDQHEKDGR